MDDQGVMCLGLFNGISATVPQLGTVQEPGSNHCSRQFNGEVGTLSFDNLAAFQMCLNLRPRH